MLQLLQKEAYAAGVKWTFAPMVDIARDPRWGRIMEGYGEDPYLGSVFAEAAVCGYQGDYIGQKGQADSLCKAFCYIWSMYWGKGLQ